MSLMALHRDLLRHKTPDSDVAETTLDMAVRHARFLQSQLVPLALCGPKVAEKKETMARARCRVSGGQRTAQIQVQLS